MELRLPERPRPGTSHAGGGEGREGCRGMEADTPVAQTQMLSVSETVKGGKVVRRIQISQ